MKPNHFTKKRDKKKFYQKAQQNTKKSLELKDGIPGFMITCEANAEKRCIKEMFNVLNQTVEVLYPNLVEQIPNLVKAWTEEKEAGHYGPKKQKTNDGDISEKVD